MKIKLLLIIMLLVGCGKVNPRPAGVQPVENGSFEDGLSRWQVMETTFGCGISSSKMGRNESGAMEINNTVPRRPDTYVTAFQIVKGLDKNTEYALSLWVKGLRSKEMNAQMITNTSWANAVQLPSGTYEWTNIVVRVNSGADGSVLIRFLSEDLGKAWIDDVKLDRLK